MTRNAILLTAVCAALSGCAAAPQGAPTSDTPAVSPAPTAPAATVSEQPSPAVTAALEERHRELAQARMNEGNWADALVHWELLVLLQPQVQRYRDALTETRAHIERLKAKLLPAAQQAHKQGHLEQAEVLYLRVLKVDRENATAAQALRDMEADRTKRAYSNRAPRMRM